MPGAHIATAAPGPLQLCPAGTCRRYGVVHSMSSAIARNKVPILYQSTFSKAATLVETHHVETATMALKEAGWRPEQL